MKAKNYCFSYEFLVPSEVASDVCFVLCGLDALAFLTKVSLLFLNMFFAAPGEECNSNNYRSSSIEYYTESVFVVNAYQLTWMDKVNEMRTSFTS